jgi:uncharacterized membrane protein
MDYVLSDSKELDEVSVLNERRHSHSVFDYIKSILHRLYITWSTNTPKPIPPTKSWPKPLRWIKIIGLIALGIQLIILGWWSSILVSRGAITFDFSIYQQGVYLISHGNLNPFSTPVNYYFRQDHSAFIMWPLSLFYMVWPHNVTFPWLQDIATVAAEIVAFLWLCDIAAQNASQKKHLPVIYLLLIISLVMLIINPWTLWSISFDFHIEIFTALFAMLTIRALHRDKKTTWIWVVLTLLSSDLAPVFLFTLGMSAVITGKHWLKRGLVICAFGLGWDFFLQATKGNLGDALENYSYLTDTTHPTVVDIIKSILAHPSRFFKAIYENRLPIYGNTSPEGFLGYFWLPTSLTSLSVLLVAALNKVFGVANPGFQNISLISFVTLGTIATLIWLATKNKGRPIAFLLGLLVCVNTIMWGVIWLPQVSNTWLRISPQQSKILNTFSHNIPKQDEVIASNGFAGKFSDRRYLIVQLGIAGDTIYNVPIVWFVIGPSVGVETASASESDSLLNEIAHLPNSHLVLNQDDIWVYKWYPPKSFIGKKLTPNSISDYSQQTIPAWTTPGPAGTIVESGPVNDWYVASNGKKGYVIDKAYWQEEPGHYMADVKISTTLQANIEVWDDSNSKLLARRIIPGTGGSKVTIDIPVTLGSLGHQYQFTGWGLWKITSTEPPGNPLEVRVWSPGGNNSISVYKISLIKA